MRYYAVVSDIHGNLPALQAVMDYLSSMQIDRIVVLGDLVGYGAEPGACIDLVGSTPGAVVIAGNHDRCSVGQQDPNLREAAAESLRWTRNVLTDLQASYLAGLPAATIVDNLFFAVHGSLYHPDEYIITSMAANKNLRMLKERFATIHVAFFGHTHVPMIISEDGLKTGFTRKKMTVELDTRRHYLINPGAVGQPRDGDSRASFLIFDIFKWAVTFVRVEYDIERAQQVIRFAGLPEESAGRLVLGI
ncbi:MAG: metallophosphoesterase family protein [Planctomycetes bacterium]|nr:metallophosphoesterase family protein [Planctomycetota bacterium]